MDKIITMPPALNINKDAYQFLGKLQYDIYSCEEPSIVLDFTPCTFSDAAFTAYFGALRSLAQKWEKMLSLKLQLVIFNVISLIQAYMTTLLHQQ